MNAMLDTVLISSLGRHLSGTGERICELASSLTTTVSKDENTSSLFADLLLDSLEQAQKITLALTEMITDNFGAGDEPHTDGDGGSAFAQGELQSVKGTAIENPVVPEKEDK